MRRVVVLISALLLVTTACGGESGEPDTDSDGAVTTQSDTTQPAEDDAGSDETPPPTEVDTEGEAGSAEGSGPSTATVTLADQTYNFSTEGAVVAQCLTDLFGIFSVQLPRVDESGGQTDGGVAIIALRQGTDPETVGQVNSIEVDVGDEKWVADEADDLFEQFDQLEAGMSQVDSVEIEGRTVRGSATFFRQNSLFGGGEVETVTGTFEATCGEERTS